MDGVEDKVDPARRSGDGTLRATQPLALNDPFECAITDTYGGRRDEAERNRECADVLSRIDQSYPITEDSVFAQQGADMAVCSCVNFSRDKCRANSASFLLPGLTDTR